MEVQVKVLDWLSYSRLVTLGEPAWRYKQKVQMKFWTDHYKPGRGDIASYPGSGPLLCAYEARENLKVTH